MKAQALCRARARKEVLPAEVLSCAVWEQWLWTLSLVGKHILWVHLAAPLNREQSKQPLARVNWGAKGSQARGCDL